MLRRLPLLSIVIIVTSIAFAACKKNTPADPPTPSEPNSSGAAVVDTTASKLLSSSSELEQGIFKYDVLPNAEKLATGQFFIEPRNFGYLQKITKVTQTNDGVIVESTPASIAELYQDSGMVTYTYDMPGSQQLLLRSSEANFRNGINSTTANEKDGRLSATQASNIVLPEISLSHGGYSLNIKDIEFTMSTVPTHQFSIKDRYLRLGFDNVSFKRSYTYSLEVSAQTEIADTLKLRNRLPDALFRKVPFGNLIIRGDLQLKDVYIILSLKAASGLKVTKKFTVENNLTAFAEYKAGKINGSYYASPAKTSEDVNLQAQGGAALTLSIVPVFQLSFFRRPVLEMGISPKLVTNFGYEPGTKFWDITGNIGGDAFARFTEKPLPFPFVDLSGELTASAELVQVFHTPDSIQSISGAVEEADQNKPLPKPIVYRVYNSRGRPESLVKVLFKSNYGKWKHDTLVTNAQGQVDNEFIMGDTDKEHELKAEIRGPDFKVIKEKIIRIKAKTKQDSLAWYARNFVPGTWHYFFHPHNVGTHYETDEYIDVSFNDDGFYDSVRKAYFGSGILTCEKFNQYAHSNYNQETQQYESVNKYVREGCIGEKYYVSWINSGEWRDYGGDVVRWKLYQEDGKFIFTFIEDEGSEWWDEDFASEMFRVKEYQVTRNKFEYSSTYASDESPIGGIVPTYRVPVSVIRK